MTSQHPASITSDAALVLRARGGDELAFRRLADRHDDLIGYIASKYFGRGLSRADFRQEGLIGLHNAVRDYRRDRSSNFRSFARLCIERQVITALKTASRRKHSPLNNGTPLSAVIRTDSEEVTLADLLADPGPGPVEQLILADEIAALGTAMYSRLSAFEWEALVLYAEGQPYKAIAARLNVSTKAVDNALQRAKEKLTQATREAVA